MKIILVDDDAFVCASLKTILQADPEITVAAVGYSAAEAVKLYQAHRPDILLMDIQMPEISGLDAAEQILCADPQARILFLTTFSDEDYIVRALRIGAKGYLIKQDIESIRPALYALMSGQSVFGREIMDKLPALIGQNAGQRSAEPDLSAFGLSSRERVIVRQVAQGFSNREIADALFLSEGTVRNYLSTILDKLALRDRTQLAVFYYKHCE